MKILYILLLLKPHTVTLATTTKITTSSTTTTNTTTTTTTSTTTMSTTTTTTKSTTTTRSQSSVITYGQDSGHCTTKKRDKCIFPFEYQNKTYFACKLDEYNPERAWCSTKVDREGMHIKGRGGDTWGFCSSDCPVYVACVEGDILCEEGDISCEETSHCINGRECLEYKEFRRMSKTREKNADYETEKNKWVSRICNKKEKRLCCPKPKSASTTTFTTTTTTAATTTSTTTISTTTRTTTTTTSSTTTPTQSPCDGGMILVLNGNCGETSCISNPCPGCNEQRNYILDPAVCGFKNKGRRLRQGATCECAGYLGFIEAKPSCSKGKSKSDSLPLYEPPKCYHEFLQGPCCEGEQLIKTIGGHTCRSNTCHNIGKFLWSNNKCYPVHKSAEVCNDRLDLVDVNMDPEDEEPKIEIACAQKTRSTNENCHIRSGFGKCLEQVKEPMHQAFNLEDLTRTFCILNLHNSSTLCTD